MWTGTIFMGSDSVPLEVIFDNASDWLTIEGSRCASCEGDTYNNKNSAFSEQVKTEVSYRSYGAISMEGNEWKDKVCVTD